MIRLFYSAGAARIVEIQLNSLTTHKSTGAPMEPSATSVSLAEHGSDATRTLTKPSVELPIRNSDT